MAHTAKNKTLGRKAGARRALLIGQSNALLQHKRIITTTAKAKALARFVAPIITGARSRVAKDVNHAHRQAFDKLRNKRTVQTLFNEVLPKVKDRPGGYTRVIKLSVCQRGDGASRSLIELVDFNPLLAKVKKTKTRRGGRRKKEPQRSDAEQSKLKKGGAVTKEMTKEMTKEGAA